MEDRLDEIDRRVIHALMGDARNTSAPMIAAQTHVSAGTIRNRIRRLEANDVITGYHAQVDFEHADGSLTDHFVCTAAVPDRGTLAKQVLNVPGVVNVREMLTGRGNLQVKAIGADTDDLNRIARSLSTLGADIESENLVRREHFRAYGSYGPENEQETPSITDFLRLAGGAEVAELTVLARAPIAGMTLQEANDEELIGEDVLVVAIEREDTVVTPKGHTEIKPDDLVTIFAREGVSDDVVQVFAGESETE